MNATFGNVTELIIAFFLILEDKTEIEKATLTGNAAAHSSAILFAMRNKVDVTLEIAIGSSTQIALFVALALVFISLLVGHPMDFVSSTFEVAAVALSTILVFMISSDGRSNWLEGAQLTGAYVIMAISFYFVETL